MQQPPKSPESLRHTAQEPELVDEADVVDAHSIDAPKPPAHGKGAVGVPNVMDITQEDKAFIEKVFHAVQHIDFLAPPPPPPRGLTGFDKKMQTLRENVRRLERDMARVGHIWTLKEDQMRHVDDIIAAEDARREQSDQRYEHIKEQATRAAAQHRLDTQAQQTRIAELEQSKQALNQTIESTHQQHGQTVAQLKGTIEEGCAERARLIEDFKQKMSTTQEAFNQLREQSTSRIQCLEEEIQSLKVVIDEGHGQLRASQQETQEAIAQQQEIQNRLGGRLSDREETVKKLTEEMGEARAELKQHLEAMQQDIDDAQATIKLRNEENSRLKEELEALQTPKAP